MVHRQMHKLLALCVLLAGCAAVGQAFGAATPEQQVAFCGSEEEYQRERVMGTEAARNVRGSDGLMPEVGWSACRILAWYGRPQEQVRVATEHGEAVHWTYITGTSRNRKARLIVFVPGADGRPVVESVVW